LSIDEEHPGQPSPQAEGTSAAPETSDDQGDHTDAVSTVQDEIDDAVRSLSGVDGLPLAEHHHHFERVHGQLKAALSDIDG
jgi:hypothetical protein